ncbi:MAG TPA: GntR family transcriptional regulator [Bryobacteraceae bacterium]|nr:GntR family transcriptional regulator [Bryobacteraceae bacterium]
MPKMVKFPQPKPGRTRRNGVMTGAVTRGLRHAIFAEEYSPGDPLLELQLAKKFRVSQAVIRESLSALAHAGLVRRIPNKGSFVMSMTPVEIGEHVRLRLTLETMAWLDAAARGDAARFAELRKRLEAIKAAVAAGNHEEVAQADLDFHREIWRMAGDSTMARLLDLVTVPLLAFVSVRRSHRHEDLTHAIPEHEWITQLLQRGDPAEIAQGCRTIMEQAYGAYLTPSPAKRLTLPTHANRRR